MKRFRSKPMLLSLTGLFVIAILVAGYYWFIQDRSELTLSVPTDEQYKKQDTEGITITICALHDFSIEVALKLLKDSDFEEKNGIKVKAILLEFEPMVQAHEMNFASDDASYDLVSIDQPSLGRYVTSGWVRPLNQFMNDSSLPSLEVEDIVPVLRNSCGKWDNKFYAVPLGSYGALLAYRTDILSAANLKPPKTFDDFLTHARQVNAPPNLFGTALFAHMGEYITADAAPFLWSWGAGLINACDVNLPDRPRYRVAWDTPEGIAALEFYATFYREGLTPPNTLEFDHVRYIGAFQSGKVAMGIMPAEGIGTPMEDPSASKVMGKIAYTTLPGRKRADGSIDPSRAGLGAHSLGLSRDGKHPREAYLVLQFLTGSQIGNEYILKGGRPFRNSHFSKEAIAAYPYLEAIRNGIKTGRCRPNIPEYPAVSKVFYTAFHSALQHGTSVAEVMRAAARKANDEILRPAYPEIISEDGTNE